MGGALMCVANEQAQTEVCNGIDDNCNGQTDEGNPGGGQACSCGGTSGCTNGQLLCSGCTKEVDCNNGVDDDGDAAIDCADSQCALGCNANVMACPAGQKLLVLGSGNINLAIPDASSTTSILTFWETMTVTRVVLQINVTHPYIRDVSINLTSPSNTTVNATSGNGGGGDNYTSTIFNDACSTAITSGTAPFNGCYKPEQLLSTFNGQPLKGAWTLTASDSFSLDTGTLTSWSLAMCVQ
jgi:subtilisin-like proprotein convertase family protein